MVTIECSQLVHVLDSGKGGELTLSELIHLYAQIVMEQSDMVDDETLQKLLCRETRSFCDFDTTVQESSRMILDAKRSTETIITAAKENDQQAMEEALEKLQGYQRRIQELEKNLHTDELTGFLNRRYLLGEKLENGRSFAEDGVLFVLQIDRFKAINDEHGFAVGDSVLKFFARNVSSLINPDVYPIIRFSGAMFVMMVHEHQVSVLERKLQGFQGILQKHTFKTSKERIVEFGLVFGRCPYRRGDSFNEVLKKASEG